MVTWSRTWRFSLWLALGLEAAGVNQVLQQGGASFGRCPVGDHAEPQDFITQADVIFRALTYSDNEHIFS
jgi:hypothetical protein